MVFPGGDPIEVYALRGGERWTFKNLPDVIQAEMCLLRGVRVLDDG